jgi:type IV pilus assembly protein PilM
MSQKVIGLDLGSYTVKAAVLKLVLRGNEIEAIETERVQLGADGSSTEAEVFAAAGRLLTRLRAANAESLYTAIPGDAVTIRSVQLPVSASRKIEQVLRFELDEALPYPIEEAVFDWVETSRTHDELQITAAIARTERVQGIVDGLEAAGFDAREIGVAGFAYAVDFQGKETEPTAVIDFGHMRTNVFISGDAVETVRTILRGGRDLTQKLAEAGKVSFEDAEMNKRREGLTGGRVSQILTEALKPLVRELRNTLAGHVAGGGKRVKRVLLCGGGSLLAGLDAFLSNELGLPIEALGVDLRACPQIQGVTPETLVLSHCLARRETIEKSKRMNLRRGALSFKGDSSLVRRRIVQAAALALAVIGAWIFSSYAEYGLLEDAAAAQDAELRKQTLAYFGKELVARDEIDALIRGTTSTAAPVPTRDAFDIVVELSKRIPTTVVHDIDLLDIKPKRITIRAQVDSELKAENGEAQPTGPSGEEGEGEDDELQLSPTDLLQKKLSEFDECFAAIRIGKVQTRGERKSYQMDIDSKCP